MCLFVRYCSSTFRRTKWRKKHANETHGENAGKRRKTRQDGSTYPIESDSNSS